MKHSIKLNNLVACGLMLSGGLATAEDNISAMEAKAPQGVTMNRAGEIVHNQTKSLLDEQRPVGGTSIRYYSSSAAGMQTLNGSNVSYNGAGCSTSNSGFMSKDEAIDIPIDSKIVSFTLLGLDNSNSEYGSASLAWVDDTGSYIGIASASSGTTNQPGRFSVGEFVDFTLGYSQGALVRLTFSDSVIELCGFRIGYVPPDVADDVIFVNNFYR